MTLLTTTSEIEYAALSGQDTFAYTFRVDNQSDMNVEIDNVAVAQGDFTMTGLGNANGGSVILNTPLVANATVLLFRVVPSTQEVDYQPFDAFPSETHEGALDKLTMLNQQNSADVARSLRYPIGDTSNPVLPNAATRLNKFLGFDSSGDAVALSSTGGDPNSVQKPLVATAGNLMEFDATKDAVDSGESATGLRASITATEIVANGSVQKSGDTMTGQLKGIAAIDNEDMMIKSEVDALIASVLASKGIATAWGSFDGTLGVTINDSYNIGSIVRNSLGDYTVTFATVMDNANYSITISSGVLGVITNAAESIFAKSVSSFTFHTKDFAGSIGDRDEIGFSIMGGKA